MTAAVRSARSVQLLASLHEPRSTKSPFVHSCSRSPRPFNPQGTRRVSPFRHCVEASIVPGSAAVSRSGSGSGESGFVPEVARHAQSEWARREPSVLHECRSVAQHAGEQNRCAPVTGRYSRSHPDDSPHPRQGDLVATVCTAGCYGASQLVTQSQRCRRNLPERAVSRPYRSRVRAERSLRRGPRRSRPTTRRTCVRDSTDYWSFRRPRWTTASRRPSRKR